MLILSIRIVALIAALFGVTAPAMAHEEAGYLRVSGPCHLVFPKDHGSHPGYRTEWWYYTGNVSDAHGRDFGYQLTFFRSQIRPPGRESDWPQPPSAWRTDQIYMGHAAVSDLQGKNHLQSERMARGALGLAGVEQHGAQTTIFLLNWRTEIHGDIHQLEADTGDFQLDLHLIAAKEPVLHGDAGYSRKGEAADRASCYYSLTRLRTNGLIRIKKEEFQVSGESWMDHEFSTAPLEPEISGWDWFSLQLSDRSEIMIYLLRRKGGGLNPVSSGTLIDASGRSRHLAVDEFSVAVVDTWHSRRSRAEYPSRWRLKIPRLELSVEITPRLADQEMQDPSGTGVTYWEGSVAVKGRKGGQSITGVGYVELTGYAGSFDAPM